MKDTMHGAPGMHSQFWSLRVMLSACFAVEILADWLNSASNARWLLQVTTFSSNCQIPVFSHWFIHKQLTTDLPKNINYPVLYTDAGLYKAVVSVGRPKKPCLFLKVDAFSAAVIAVNVY